MIKGLTQKQLNKGLIRIEDTTEFLHDLLQGFIDYKRTTKHWQSCTNHREETIHELYQEIIDCRNDLSNLQRKYL